MMTEAHGRTLQTFPTHSTSNCFGPPPNNIQAQGVTAQAFEQNIAADPNSVTHMYLRMLLEHFKELSCRVDGVCKTVCQIEEDLTILRQTFHEYAEKDRTKRSDISSLLVNEAANKKPTSQIVRLAQLMTCSANGCMFQDAYDQVFMIYYVWSIALINRPSGSSFKSGCFLGIHIVENLKSCGSGGGRFFPADSELLPDFFLPVTHEAFTHMKISLDTKHTEQFYSHNKKTFDSEIFNFIRNTRNTRKTELCRQFKSFRRDDDVE